MKAKVQCSACGADVSELKLSYGKKQLWFLIPILVLGFWPITKLTFFKEDISKDLAVSEVKVRPVGTTLEVIGLITNSSKNRWTGLTVEAEFFNASGEFMDEAVERLQADVAGNSEEHFKFVVRYPPQQALDGTIEPVVKISSGYTRSF